MENQALLKKSPAPTQPQTHAKGYAEDYRISVEKNGRNRQVVWHSHSALALTFPVKWILEKRSDGFLLMNKHTKETFLLSHQVAQSGEWITQDDLKFQITRLKRIPAAYLTPAQKLNASHPTLLFYGVRKSLLNYKLASKFFEGTVDGSKVFDYKVGMSDFCVVAYQEGVSLRLSGENRRELNVGQSEWLPNAQLSQLRVSWKHHWWRLNQIDLTPPVPAHLFEDRSQEDENWFRDTSKKIGLTFALMAFLFYWIPFPKQVTESQPTTIVLKKPKVVATKPRTPKTNLAQIPKKEPKLVTVTPKPVPKAAKKAATTPALKKPVQIAKPQPAPVVPTVPKPAPAPVKVAAPAPPVPQAPSPQAIAAMKAQKAKAQLSKSLGFLSTNPKAVTQTVNYTETTAAVETVAANSKIRKDSKYLASLSLSGASATSGSIQTTGIRGVSDARIVGDAEAQGLVGSGKGLNRVLGKVALSGLYGEASGEEGEGVGGALGKNGISFSGSGQVDEKLIVDALSKRLDRLQYCYEKSLLTDPSLSGNIMMEWAIQASGGVSSVKVVKSQMNNASLHKCISKEISSIHFPSPQGGSVTVRYPLNFSSTSL